MYIYNTLTNKKEELKTIHPGEVRMYSCGPTVYSYAHIGNLRTYIFMDLLRRTLKEDGYKITGVMNITDVGHLTSDADSGEDKMEKAAKAQKKSPLEIAAHYTSVFMKDIVALNIGIPEVVPKATEHIQEMIDFVKGLEEKGYAYETDDGIYFDIVKYGKYGVLSKLDLEEQMAGARVEVNDQKRHPADFALWTSLLTGSLLLGIMILSTIITVAESALNAVPDAYYEGALALGATHESSVFRVVLPAAKSGVTAGIVLGIGRAIGEATAVMMVTGNRTTMPSGLLKGVRTLTSNIAIEMGYATDLHREALIATGVVLFVLIMLINLLSSVLKGRTKA